MEQSKAVSHHLVPGDGRTVALVDPESGRVVHVRFRKDGMLSLKATDQQFNIQRAWGNEVVIETRPVPSPNDVQED